MKGVLTALVAVATLTACQPSAQPDIVAPVIPEPANAPETELELTPEQIKARTSEYVFSPYDRGNYPKLYALLGGEPTDRIQRVREEASRRALASGRCDYVELAEVSNQRTTKDNISVFVDCRNSERFNVSESDVRADVAASANSDRTVSRGDAITACVNAAKSMATFPSLFDPHVWTGSTYQTYKTLGTARVMLDFDAQNALGVNLPYTANCLFSPGSLDPDLTISER